jgi:hypothetical protein
VRPEINTVAMVAARMMAPSQYHWAMKSVMPSNMRVIRGNLAFNELKNVWNLGSTQPASTITVTTDIIMTTMG